jgi:hypothetical protein
MNVLNHYIKSHMTYAFRRAVREIATEGRICLRHWSAARKAPKYLRDQPLRLNLGCGPNSRPGWLNIDLFFLGADLQLDLRKRWPFRDGTVAHIYSEHVFEHFEFSENFRTSGQSRYVSFRRWRGLPCGRTRH